MRTAARLPLRVEKLVREAGLWSPGDRLLVALSGGADSVALLHLLAGVAKRDRLELHAAHVNYGLRGEASDGDEAFCRNLCADWGIPLHVLRAPEAPPSNVQAWARRIRHDWFAELTRTLACRKIALGHHANDCAETVVLQWLRGASRKGVANMSAKSGCLIRPLITTDRLEIETYLRSHGIGFRTDASNQTAKYRRNRVRNEVLPLLSDVFDTNAARALAGSARLFGLEADYLDSQASQHRHLLERSPGGLRIEVGSLLALHPALGLRLLNTALSELSIRPTRDRLFRLLDLAGRPAGKRIRLGDSGTAERGREHLWLYTGAPEWPELAVAVPGVTRLPDGSLLHVTRSTSPAQFPRGDYEIDARLESPLPELRLRAARAGDRIRPFGGLGSHLVFDLLSEAGVPRFLRTRRWVLEDRQRILWLLGHRPAEEIRVGPGSDPVYHFRWDTESRQ